jgi:thiol-disulfide isomerase/thioredoxin
MTLIELGSPSALQEFIASHRNVIVTFSAHWCGPCKASHPALRDLADQAKADVTKDVRMGIVYESDISDAIHDYAVRAFPTYVLFQNQRELERVEGVNFVAIQAMIDQHCVTVLKGGTALGSSSSAADATAYTPLSPAAAREARLARLTQNHPSAPQPVPAPSMPAADRKPTPTPSTANENAPDDVEMMDADTNANTNTHTNDPTAELDPNVLRTLTDDMGFPLLRAQKGLLFGNGATVEAAVEWLTEHQDDDDIDEPIPANAGAVAQSYKCNECGKILSNMANLELHANKTGHSDFEESTTAVKPLTDDEKKAKIAEIKELLRLKRAEREEAEKVDLTEREKQRRMMGKEMSKTREEVEKEQRKREAYLRKKEKDDFKRERARIRAELAKDKAERQSNKGKLSSKLGIDGYNPDGIQYDVPGQAGGDAAMDDEQHQHHQQKRLKASAAKIDEYITKVSAYKAGGDGGKCLKVLKIYIGNVVDHPDDPKYRSINTDNKAFKIKVKPFIGAKALLLAVGFAPSQSETALELGEGANHELLVSTKGKLESAIAAYG